MVHNHHTLAAKLSERIDHNQYSRLSPCKCADEIGNQSGKDVSLEFQECSVPLRQCSAMCRYASQLADTCLQLVPRCMHVSEQVHFAYSCWSLEVQ